MNSGIRLSLTFPSSSTTRMFLTRTFLSFRSGSRRSADDFVQVLLALQALEAERDARHDGLFLLDDHARVRADCAQVEVILDPESEPEHQRQQQQQPGAETLISGLSKSHAETMRGKSASDVVQFGKPGCIECLSIL